MLQFNIGIPEKMNRDNGKQTCHYKMKLPGAAAMEAVTVPNQHGFGKKRQLGRILAAKIANVLNNLMIGNYSELWEWSPNQEKLIDQIALLAHELNEVCICGTS